MRDNLILLFIIVTFSLTACVATPPTKASRSVKSGGDIAATAKVGGKESYSVKKARAEARARTDIAAEIRLMAQVKVVDVICADGSILYPRATECRERFKPAIDEYLVEAVALARPVSTGGDRKRVRERAPVSVALVLSGKHLVDQSTLRYGNYVDKVFELIGRAGRALTYDIKYELLTDARHKLLKAVVFKGTSAGSVDSDTEELFFELSRKIQRAEHQKRR